jgi:hypothetical protein
MHRRFDGTELRRDAYAALFPAPHGAPEPRRIGIGLRQDRRAEARAGVASIVGDRHQSAQRDLRANAVRYGFRSGGSALISALPELWPVASFISCPAAHLRSAKNLGRLAHDHGQKRRGATSAPSVVPSAQDPGVAIGPDEVRIPV